MPIGASRLRLSGMQSRKSKRGARFDVAKRALQTCGQIMRYAVAHDLPSAILLRCAARRRVEGPQETQLCADRCQELPELLRKIEEYDGSECTVLGLKLMVYTFVRTTELIYARWEEFDIPGALACTSGAHQGDFIRSWPPIPR